MELLIVSTAPFIFKDEKCFAYSPYVKELVILEKYVSEISFCCPVWKNQNGLLIEVIPFDIKNHYKLFDFNLNNFINIAKAIFYALVNGIIVFKAMYQADHIHLRCPGNIGLLGCFVQILFPNTPKTVKYAGNWDPKAIQPWSYRIQKWILSNTFLTRNMKVLVYGEWEGNSKNIQPFFTATYWEAEKVPLKTLTFAGPIRFIFVGTLSQGKRPMYAVALVEALSKRGYEVHLELYGEGPERKVIEDYILKNKLEALITLKGNQSQAVVKVAYQNSHFVVLPSQSEGWPKALAEGMFWGCVAVAPPISCVPFMLGYGEHGVLLAMQLESDAAQLEAMFQDQEIYLHKRVAAANWSRHYTLDRFEDEIKRMLRDA
ncbi:Glycosyltransferase involved in cell wall bisynthesis [Flavobacterium succinicans]|uniref:Glycosyltransferase involved in cell wall bisynthesis n=1 Tax=Flavobacterium succinicans TaxID=29536 RepID=A0A1I4SI16_9FLAO|nr:glycosyltransferase [Flavobacterium succinicans]SFM64072.1 Glycosyltransferase involved in cell wall bisynthesis [Flavobacterium succinicans]